MLSSASLFVILLTACLTLFVILGIFIYVIKKIK